MHTSRNIRNAGTISIYLLFCNPVKIYEVWSMKKKINESGNCQERKDEKEVHEKTSMGKKKIQLRWQVHTKGKNPKVVWEINRQKSGIHGKRDNKKKHENSVYACFIGLLAFLSDRHRLKLTLWPFTHTFQGRFPPVSLVSISLLFVNTKLSVGMVFW